MKTLNLIRNYFFKRIAQRTYKNSLNTITMKKILLIKSGGIGDAICIYPLLREIKKNYPDLQLDICAGTSNYFMYPPTPYLDNIYYKHKKREWYKTWYTIFQMRRQKYDLVMDLTVISFKRTLSSIFINPRYIIAMKGKQKKYGFNRSVLSFYHTVFTEDTGKHIVDNYLQLLSYINIVSMDNSLEFFLKNNVNKQLKVFLDTFKNTKLVGLNTDASNKNRTLNNQQIITLSHKLKSYNISIVLFCMPNKRSKFQDLITNEDLSNIRLTYPTQNIFDAAEIIARMDLIISPDTSFIHIASGLNIPTIGLYWNIPEKKILWGPKSDVQAVITPMLTTDFHLKNIDMNIVSQKVLKFISS